MQDPRLAFRQLAQTPGFTIPAPFSRLFHFSRLLSRSQIGVIPFDPINLARAPLFPGLVSLPVCHPPARRATRVNPIEALRAD